MILKSLRRLKEENGDDAGESLAHTLRYIDDFLLAFSSHCLGLSFSSLCDYSSWMECEF